MSLDKILQLIWFDTQLRKLVSVRFTYLTFFYPAKSTAITGTEGQDVAKPVLQKEENKSNLTATTATPNMIDLDTPGVVKRGIIVFGGFALLAVAYLIFK